jgi:virulence-associated protein VagC
VVEAYAQEEADRLPAEVRLDKDRIEIETSEGTLEERE